MRVYTLNQLVGEDTTTPETMSNAIVTVRYVDNGSARYDSKEFQELLSKIRREKNATGSLKTGETVTIKTKSHL